MHTKRCQITIGFYSYFNLLTLVHSYLQLTVLVSAKLLFAEAYTKQVGFVIQARSIFDGILPEEDGSNYPYLRWELFKLMFQLIVIS